jgi:dienelactone hydrolase
MLIHFKLRHIFLVLTIGMCAMPVILGSSITQAQQPSSLPLPGQTGKIICGSDATQTYVLYLPSGYAIGKQWPIIYLFDPGGRGGHPVELYKDVAEQYGFILAGSNNSRNFSSDQAKSVNAIWQDTHERLSLDEHRSYASGFSGGARVAGAMALSGPPGQIAGVIAHGAGYPSNRVGSKDDLPYFFAVGDEDFNWPEVITIRREREEHGSPYRVRVFHGKHQWAPAVEMGNALQYMNLKAMQSGHLTVEPVFIDRALNELKTEAAQAEASNDAIAQLNAYHALVSDFSGLRDLKDANSKLAIVQQSPALKTALKNEREQMSEQLRQEQEIAPKIESLANNSVPDANALRLEIRQQMGGLYDQAKHSKNETKRLISIRAFSGIFVRAIEAGQQELDARHFEKAETYFDLMRLVTDDPWPVLLLADTHAASGNRKLAIKDLQEAVRRGLKDPTVIESDARLHILKGDPDFEKLLAGVKAN